MGTIAEQRFGAQELNADATLSPVTLAVSGSPEAGWTITRNDAPHLELGPGYRLLATERCGVCSTDLDRPGLPFPPPQVVGHELIARDESGRRLVVEINASHAARGSAEACPFCRSGLATHCPERLVLGIHDLPGGFGPFVLAPAEAAIVVPACVSDDVAVLVEPFAAALHAVDRIGPQAGDRVAVLGTRRLGLLAIAALAARRRERDADYTIVAWSRHEALRDRARALGADVAAPPPEAGDGPRADVVIDTTGSPDGFALALALAGREVHLKSTHGRASGGLRHATELVVDEIGLAPLHADPDAIVEALSRTGLETGQRAVVAWLSAAPAPSGLEAAVERVRGADAAALLGVVEGRPVGLPRADAAVVDRVADIDTVLRPVSDREISLVRPRGTIFLHPTGRETAEDAPIAAAVRDRGLRLGTSRCGDFRSALALLERDPALRESLAQLVTHRLPASRLGEALRLARSADAVKVVVEHGGDAAS